MLICLLGSKQSCTRSVCKSRLGSCKLRQYQAFSIRCDHRVYAYRPSENSRARADRNNPVCPVSLSPAFPLLNLTQARARRSIRVRFYLLATAFSTVEEGKFSSPPPPARPSEFVNWRSHLQLLKKAVVRNHPASPSLVRKLEQCEQCSTHERNLGTSPAIAA